VTVAVSELSDEGRRFVQFVFDQHVPPERRTAAHRAPEHVTFWSRQSPGSVAPTVFVQLEGYGGYGYLGGRPLTQQFEEHLTAEWLLAGDEVMPDREQAAVPRGAGPPAEPSLPPI
jgi:hypothetical protein